MPKVLIFAPCEKVIIDQDNTVSMMTILEDLKVQIRSDKSVLPNSAIPMTWAILTLWQRQEGEEGKEFEERCDLLSEEGKNLVTGKIKFKVMKQTTRVLMKMVGFPIKPGQCKIKMSIRESGESSEWEEIAEYPLPLHVQKLQTKS